MPNFDGTGPNGLGPMYGKGRGQCKRKQNFSCPFARQINDNTTVQENIEALKTYKKKLEAKIEALEKEVK